MQFNFFFLASNVQLLACRHRRGEDLCLSGLGLCQGSVAEGEGDEGVRGVCEESIKMMDHGSWTL